MKGLRERDIEIYLVLKAQTAGGWAYKFVSPGAAGVPDRIVILPGGRIAFVELKAPGRTSTPIQALQQRRLQALGCRVYADIDSKDKVDQILQELTQA
jgi:hypothetical protein